MKKIINKPEDFVKETVEGIVAAYGDQLKLGNGDYHVLLSNYEVKPGKVGIVTGGGSGHLPVFLGYVGKGMLDGCTVGNVFASPSAAKMEDTIRACDFGSGVLCLYGNYGGDDMNFHMACESVEMDEIETRIVKVCDDVASSLKGEACRRRGIAGMVYAFKIAGAAADQMRSLDEVETVAREALDNIRTIGAALSSCIVPQVGKPTFFVGDGDVEIGMGIHGEAGIEVRRMMTADELSALLFEKLLEDMPLAKGDEVSVMVNGLGATPLEEQMIVYRNVHEMLMELGVSIVAPHIGEFATSMEMAGVSLTIFKLNAGLKELLLQPAVTPFYRM